MSEYFKNPRFLQFLGQVGTRLYTELDLKIIRGIVNMGIKDYSQLIDIVNFCGKQHNISSSKKHMALIYCQWSNDLGLLQDQVITFVYHKAF